MEFVFRKESDLKIILSHIACYIRRNVLQLLMSRFVFM